MARGRVLFVSSGLHSPWNTLTRTNAVLVFDRIFRAALEETLPGRNHETVDEIRLPLAASERRASFVLHRPAALSVAGAVPARAPEPLAVEALGADLYGLAIRNPVRRGFYRVAALPEGSDGASGLEAKLWEAALAVNGPEAESELRPIDEATLKERLGKAAYRWIGREDPLTLEGAAVRGQNLWKWLLALALGGLLFELLFLARPVVMAERRA
jgi:hypothetical protein